MVRRLQLLDEPERRFGRVRMLVSRIRDGLLRDNKIVAPVLAVLALLVFAWLVAGLLMRSPGEEEQQASNQASLSQAPKEDTNNGSSATPAPGVENRDTESFAAFGKPKDPFELPKGIESKAGGSTNGSTTGSSGGNRNGSGSSSSNGSSSRGGSSGSNGGSSSSGSGRSGSGGGGGESTDQSSRNPGGAGGAGGRTTGGNNPGGGPSAGGGGNGGLFNSGGDLPVP